MYDRVLLPTDGSETAASAVDHAIDAAARHEATVHLLYVIDESVANAAPGLAMGHVREKLKAEGERAIADLEDQIEDAGLETTTEIRQGNPDTEILNYIDDADIDIVTVGSTGKTVNERERVGSVTDSLVRKAGVPVVSVPTV
ncbi:universal stress protein [Halorientalis salina]|uniref:universal stress protein n=1 Tax=Halorientalis salina TaxID=2932266 RepID=UPI0010AD315C|nr:universal stress protein [Halorientalis salina]